MLLFAPKATFVQQEPRVLRNSRVQGENTILSWVARVYQVASLVGQAVSVILVL